MSYVPHDFQPGQHLYAEQLNEMDAQIRVNDLARTYTKTEYLMLAQGLIHTADYPRQSSNTGYADRTFSASEGATVYFDDSIYKVIEVRFNDAAYAGIASWVGTSPIVIPPYSGSAYDTIRIEIRRKNEANTDFTAATNAVWVIAENVVKEVVQGFESRIEAVENSIGAITQKRVTSFLDLGNFIDGHFITVTGITRDNTDWKYSDFIEVSTGDHFLGNAYVSAGYSALFAMYDAEKNFLPQHTIADTTSTQYSWVALDYDFAIPNDVKYIRVSINKAHSPNTMTAVLNNYDKNLQEHIDKAIGDRGYNPYFAHLSFDDVRYCMEDITANSSSYSSIFSNPFFAMLKNLHDTYGTKVSLYLFTENIANYTTKYAGEFAENADWLKFGLHVNQSTAGNYESTSAAQATSDYNAFTAAIVTICGTVKAIDRCPRLSNFAGNEQSVLAMRDADSGIVGLLTAYDTRNSYYLDATDSAYVFTHGKLYDATRYITFFRSLKAMEATDPTATLPKLLTLEGANGAPYLIMMMHEYGVYNSSYQLVSAMKDRLEYGCSFAKQNGYSWDFPQNRC